MITESKQFIIPEYTNTSSSYRSRIIIPYLIISSLLTILVPLILSGYGYSLIKTILVVVLLSLCFFPAIRYLAFQESGLPALPILSLAYALQFAIPVLTNEPKIRLSGGYVTELSDESVIAALLLSICGIMCLLIGYYSILKSSILRTLKPVKLEIDTNRAIVYCLLVGALVPILSANHSNLRESNYFTQFSAILWIVQNQILVVIAILARLIFTGRISKWFYLFLLTIICISTMQGVSTGLLEQAVLPIATLLIARWQTTKKVPVGAIAIGILIIVFLSPTKTNYRLDAWYGRNEVIADSGSQLEKAQYWITQASEYWVGVFSREKNLVESTEISTSRLDLIHQFAYIYALTPEVVPYQFGSTYSYFLVTFIPRFIWPDKPEVGSANRFFAVSYGVTTEEGARRTTFGVSLLAESYVNFSWYGVILIMMLQGMTLAGLQYFFGGDSSGIGAQAVFIAFFVYFLNGVGTSAEVMFGNITQGLLFNILLLRWISSKSLINSRDFGSL